MLSVPIKLYLRSYASEIETDWTRHVIDGLLQYREGLMRQENFSMIYFFRKSVRIACVCDFIREEKYHAKRLIPVK